MAYTDIDDPSAHFQTTLYSGNGGNGHVITHTGNSDLQADMVWIKMRSAAYPPVVYDTSRRPSGTPFSGSLYVFSIGNNYATAAENTGAYGPTAIGSNSVTMNSYDTINKNSQTFVSWNWKANGGTTTSVSASGSGNLCINASAHQVNTDAGFSIITYTGRDDELSSEGLETKLTHGLGVTPHMAIIKKRDGTSPWYVIGQSFSVTEHYWEWSYSEYMLLNTTAPNYPFSYTGNRQPDSTHIYLGGQVVNDAGDDYVAYVFAEKQGFSRFFRYIGNGQAEGPFVHTGFKPAFVMIKLRADYQGASEPWVMYDNKRSPFNRANKKLSSDSAAAENSYSAVGGAGYNDIDMLSNGFKLRTNNAVTNSSGKVYSYMAFAENPFVTSTGTPTTAR